jgi:enterochelin esterase-like enzyme
MRKTILLFIILTIGLTSCQNQQNMEGLKISLTADDTLKSSIEKTGRLFVFFSKNENSEPRYQLFPSPIDPPMIYAVNIEDYNADNSLELDDNINWTSTTDLSLSEIPEGDYTVQVLWDQDTIESRINAPGNIYSKPQKISVNNDSAFEINLSQIIPERTIIKHDLVREVRFKSDTLSSWWNKPIELKASILLPSDYDKTKTYPIRYNVAGYGGRYTRVENLVKNEEFMSWWNSEDSPQVINVFLDGKGPFGDSYQMDSENSGPYGYSLIYELIPHIENKYRNTSSPKTRFVDGCSTGGWVSLGLQLYYPEQFNGVFSYSPDAIEFENYQLMNIYEDKNAFTNEFGYARPCMRNVDGEPMVSMKDFIRFENVQGSSDTYLNSGDQFSSHTALYSPKGENGLPKPLFDPVTGDIDSEVAEHWKKYDFKLYAEKNWETLGPNIEDKIYIWMGDMDHFYLNMATRKFADFLETTQNPKSNAVIEFSPYEGHCSRFNHKLVLEQIQKRLNQIQ